MRVASPAKLYVLITIDVWQLLIHSIAKGADYSFNVKSIATFALTFFWYRISVLASVSPKINRKNNLSLTTRLLFYGMYQNYPSSFIQGLTKKSICKLDVVNLSFIEVSYLTSNTNTLIWFPWPFHQLWYHAFKGAIQMKDKTDKYVKLIISQSFANYNLIRRNYSLA